MIRRLPLKNHGDFIPDTIVCSAETYMRSLTRDLVGGTNDSDNGLRMFFTIVLIFAFLFMLLPALNLVNINVSRIMERASEIGIRKAFGASAGTLTVQFVIENVILTIIGGGVALVLSSLVIAYLNRTGVGPIPNLSLTINWTVLGVALGLSLFFGLMSGVIPAFRMAKLPVAEALKG
jgi:putative ABC transport system permease protein